MPFRGKEESCVVKFVSVVDDGEESSDIIKIMADNQRQEAKYKAGFSLRDKRKGNFE